MKKSFYILLGILLMAVSCKKDDLFGDAWSGTYDSSEYAGYEYMLRIADNLIVDNLKQIETAIFVQNTSTGNTSTRFNRSGSIWDSDCKWVVTHRGGSLEGLEITRAAADSTWTLKRDGKYDLGYGEECDFDTKYEMDVRMLRDTSSRASSDHFWWKVTLKECTRTEDEGFVAKISTLPGKTIDYQYGSFCNWSYCFGVLTMQVFKGEEVMDVARLQLNGTRNSSDYIRNL